MANSNLPTGIGKYALWVCVFVVVLFLGVESWSTWRSTQDSARLLDSFEKVPSSSLSDEKTRQEAIGLRLKNEQQRIFISSLVSNLSVTVGLIAAISGGWIAFAQYLRTRTRERLDRAAIDFAALWEGLSSKEADKRAGSVAALSDYLAEDKADFHGRVASALALVGRMKNEEVVNRTLTPVVELAMRQCPGSVRSVSWQSLKLFRANFSGLPLKGLDLRDCDLEEADFRGADLEGSRFDAARLVGAQFDGAKLAGASFAYADLARASMRRADLKQADLRNIQLLDLDIEGADLQGAAFAPHATDWRLVKSWRNAILDPKMRTQLLDVYGPPAHGPKVLMLAWEYPPIVSGGGWTAVYHFLSTLSRRGADISVIVPLPMSYLDRSVFGNEIQTIGVGKEEDVKSLAETSAYTSYRSESDLQRATERFQYARAAASLMTLVDEFQLRTLRAVDEMKLEFDVIHAHDWLTFPAAAAISKTLGKPWVAHFHSTEEDRQPGEPSPRVMKIEAEACRNATRLVAVSKVTAERLRGSYQAPKEKVDVVPNCFADEGPANTNLGSFSSSRVVFLGRLAKQKGIDRFVEIAKNIRKLHRTADFVVYGDGPEKSQMEEDAREWNSEMPADEEVPPLSENDIKVGVRYVGLDEIAAVVKDSAGAISVRAPVNRQMRAALGEEILRRGFTAKPIDDARFTHLIHVADSGEGMVADYYVQASGLQKISKWTTSYVSTRGGLPWLRRFEAFDRAAVVIVPSRFEPFGLVVLEAMKQGVPVVYPREAGAAEVLRSGVRFKDLQEAEQETLKLLTDKAYWEKTSEAQLEEIAQYPSRHYEALLEEVWNRAATSQLPAQNITEIAIAS